MRQTEMHLTGVLEVDLLLLSVWRLVLIQAWFFCRERWSWLKCPNLLV